MLRFDQDKKPVSSWLVGKFGGAIPGRFGSKPGCLKIAAKLECWCNSRSVHEVGGSRYQRSLIKDSRMTPCLTTHKRLVLTTKGWLSRIEIWVTPDRYGVITTSTPDGFK